MWDIEHLKSKYGIHGLATDDIVISLVSRRKGPGVIVSEIIMGPVGVEIPGYIDVKYNWCMAI